MAPIDDDIVIVSPREISDVVARCCRVAGCDAGTAARLGRNVLHAEIHRGAAITTFLRIWDAGATAVMDVAAVADRVESAEVAARTQGTAPVMFEQPVALIGLSQTLADATRRGVVAPEIAPTASAGVLVDSLELVTTSAITTSAAEQAAAERRHVSAHQSGLAVTRSAWDRLESAAHAFLVAEATLDAIAADDEVR